MNYKPQKSIILRRGQLVWIAEHYRDGQPDAAIEMIFGTHKLPTVFRNFHDAGEVAVWIAQRYPGTTVEAAS